MKRSALTRRTPLRSGSALPRTRLKPVSARQRVKQREWASVCAKRLKACGGRCERCDALAHLQGHHKLPRSQGGLNVDGNCAMLCADCHCEVHEFPAFAYAWGWLLHPWDAPIAIGGAKEDE